MERRNNSLFSLLMTHDSCGRGGPGEGGNKAGGGKQRGLSVTEQGKWQIIHGFQKSVEAPSAPCPAKYSAGCMHFPPQRCHFEYSAALCTDVCCVQSAYA